MIEFEAMSFAEALKMADEGETWIVENIVSAGTTLLYGEAKSGKSFLVSALIKSLTTGADFLGKPVPQDRAFSVAVCWTDDMGPVEYSDRIRMVMPDDEPDVSFYRLPIMRTPDMWAALYERIMSEGHNIVVVDNMAQTLDGSVNDDAVIRQFFDGVRRFTRAGIPVVVVAHSSDKAGANGYKPDTPMGSAYITQAVRWRVFVRRSRRGNVTLKLMGNHAEPYEMTLHHGAGPRFDVIDVKTADALKASAEGAARGRTQDRLDDNMAIATWVAQNCAGMSQRQAAEKLAADRGISPESARTKIRRSGVEKVGGEWVAPGAA